MGGVSLWQLLILLVIVLLLFGGKKLRSLGSDLGSSIRGFKKEMSDEETPAVEKKDADFTDTKTEQKDKTNN